jgi:hypothetical protein
MNMLPVILAIAAAQKQQAEEEASMQSEAGYEYKVMRSATGSFRNRETLARMLDEEHEAGWELAEKLDDRRVRLKRSVEHRAADSSRTFDPYRTTFGMGEAAFALLVTVGTLGVLVILLLIVGLIVSLLK